MLTQVMPALVRSLGNTLNQNDLRSLMQVLGNCNQTLEHRGPVNLSPTLPQFGAGGGMYNGDYWDWNEYNNIVNEGDQYSFFDISNDNRDFRTIRQGDINTTNVFNEGNQTIINLINNPPGQRGDPGEKGDTGDPGRDGLDGRDGRDGLSVVGPAGPPGQDGADGRDGLDGPAGPPGVTTVVVIGDPGNQRSKEIKFVKSLNVGYGQIRYMKGGTVTVTCADDGSIAASFNPVFGFADYVEFVEGITGTATVLAP
jgi:hypothetical protein